MEKQEAQRIFEESERIHEEGRTCLKNKEWELARVKLLEVLALQKKLNQHDSQLYNLDELDMVSVLHELGDTYYRREGGIDQGLAYYKQAVELQEKISITEGEFPEYIIDYLQAVYLIIGKSYYYRKKYDEALPMLKIALQYQRMILGYSPEKHRKEATQALFKIGFCYWKTGNYDLAEKYLTGHLETCEYICEKFNPDFGEQRAMAMHNLAAFYYEFGRWQPAKKYYEKAFEQFSELDAGNKEKEYANVLELEKQKLMDIEREIKTTAPE